MNEFIKINNEFWSKYKIKEGNKDLLIEEPTASMITHANAIFALILNQAKEYNATWLYDNNSLPKELLCSYISNAKFINFPKKSVFLKIYIKLIALKKFLRIYLTKDVLNFYYDGVKYGDILYDTYLSKKQVATIKRIDYSLLKFMELCIARHIKIKNILQNGHFAGVLVSHQVGIGGGVMLRVALRYGYEGYLRAGHHQITLQCFKNSDEVYDYEYKPFPSDIKKIIFQFKENLDGKFKEIFSIQVASEGDKEGLDAFSDKNKFYTNRESFNKDYNLDKGKKNIFIMLHAFNDYPHSHFRWMIFKDYFDWFIETLKYAKTNNKVNWIFKQHPSVKYYTTKDISMDKLFDNCPSNIIYIDENKQIDTRSLIYCADLVVTCLGSAGFELPAMGAISSMTASDNFYTNLGFAIEPKNKREYFKNLDNAYKIERLTKELQDKAKAAYIYIYKIARVNISACPKLSFVDEKDKNIANWYWDKVIEQYNFKKETIINEVNSYIKEVKKDNFKHLISNF